MKNVWLRNKKSKLSLYSKILLGTLALAVIVGLGSAAYGASDNTDNKTNVLLLKPMDIFNPFTLITLKSTRVTVTQSESESEPSLDTLLTEILYVRSTIQIPFRQRCVLPLGYRCAFPSSHFSEFSLP